MKTYPQAPGYKGEAETGRQAAKRVESKADQLRKRMLRWIASKPMTHDECAEKMRGVGMSDVQFEVFKRSVRSRGSELKAAGYIEDSGLRRENSSGTKAVVWRLAKQPEVRITVNENQNTASTKAVQQELL